MPDLHRNTDKLTLSKKGSTVFIDIVNRSIVKRCI
jgi:hypothetical protein